MATPAKDIAIARQAFSQGDFALAARMLKRVLAAQPGHSLANELMGYVEANRGNLARARELLTAATRAPGASAASWYYLGRLALQEERLDEAESAMRRALSLDAGFFEALHDLGRLLQERGEYAEAVECLQRAGAANPASFEVHHNLGRSLRSLGRYAEALEEYDRALASNARSAETWLNRGEVLHDLGRMEAALECYARARELRPDYPEAAANAAFCLLARGEWEAGWREMEARWRGAGGLRERHAAIARWRGEEPVAGKRILVWAEQGFGDTLQFCRLVAPLVERGAEVILEVQEPLRALLEANLACRVVAVDEPVPSCDWQLPLLSLAGVLGVKPGEIPARVPYIRAPSDRVGKWRERLGPRGDKLRAAITCSGRVTHKHESRRRIALADLAVLAPHAEVFVVQKHLEEEDRRALERGAIDAEYLGDELIDFRDGAGIIANMDVVVSIDTSIAHLAGAMAKPVWLMLADVPDWRWMLERADSPWYPTARLFRQKRPGDWAGVLEEVRHALQDFQPSR